MVPKSLSRIVGSLITNLGRTKLFQIRESLRSIPSAKIGNIVLSKNLRFAAKPKVSIWFLIETYIEIVVASFKMGFQLNELKCLSWFFFKLIIPSFMIMNFTMTFYINFGRHAYLLICRLFVLLALFKIF